jgi:insertion element IS1 protein InsB
MDELWSFVYSKALVIWVWIARERQTRKVVGLAFTDRSAEECRQLWRSLPPDYRKRALIYTDEWQAYATVLPAKRDRPVPKESGETSHIERLNNTLRQWCANLVRKTLSLSKDTELHKTRIRLVIDHCNTRADLWAAV